MGPNGVVRRRERTVLRQPASRDAESRRKSSSRVVPTAGGVQLLSAAPTRCAPTSPLQPMWPIGGERGLPPAERRPRRGPDSDLDRSRAVQALRPASDRGEPRPGQEGVRPAVGAFNLDLRRRTTEDPSQLAGAVTPAVSSQPRRRVLVRRSMNTTPLTPSPTQQAVVSSNLQPSKLRHSAASLEPGSAVVARRSRWG
jgi:hypothetical protein